MIPKQKFAPSVAGLRSSECNARTQYATVLLRLAGRGLASHGGARQGAARQGLARRGRARPGVARRGSAGQGAARQGKATTKRKDEK